MSEKFKSIKGETTTALAESIYLHLRNSERGITGKELSDDIHHELSEVKDSLLTSKLAAMERQIKALIRDETALGTNILTLSNELHTSVSNMIADTTDLGDALDTADAVSDYARKVQQELVIDEDIANYTSMVDNTAEIAEAAAELFENAPGGATVTAATQALIAINREALVEKYSRSRQHIDALPDSLISNHSQKMALEKRVLAEKHLSSDSLDLTARIKAEAALAIHNFAIVDKLQEFYSIDSSFNLTLQSLCTVYLVPKNEITRDGHSIHSVDQILIQFAWPISMGSLNIIGANTLHVYDRLCFSITLSNTKRGIDIRTSTTISEVTKGSFSISSTSQYSYGATNFKFKDSRRIGQYQTIATYPVANKLVSILRDRKGPDVMVLYRFIVMYCCSAAVTIPSNYFDKWTSSDDIDLLSAYYSSMYVDGYTISGIHHLSKEEIESIITAGGHDSSGYHASIHTLYVDAHDSSEDMVSSYQAIR